MAYKLLGFKPSHPSASGTALNDGGAIGEAVRRQHRVDLALYASHVRRQRSPQEWREMYAAAMKEKRGKSGA